MRLGGPSPIRLDMKRPAVRGGCTGGPFFYETAPGGGCTVSMGKTVNPASSSIRKSPPRNFFSARATTHSSRWRSVQRNRTAKHSFDSSK